MTHSRTMNAALSLVSLGRLPRGTTGKVFPTVGRPRAHGTAAVGEGVAAHGDRMKPSCLTRRPPERNVVEHLDDDLKSRIDPEGLPGIKGELRSRFQRLMRGLLRLPEHVKSYYRHPPAQDAAR